MDDSFMMFFDLISIGCGCYILYTWLKLRTAGILFPNNLLIPKDKSPKQCKNQEEYIRYILPKTLITGIVITVFGIVSLINEYAKFFGLLGSELLILGSLVAIAWYGVCLGKAGKRYW